MINLNLQIKTSKIADALMLFLHLLAIAAVLYSALNIGLKIGFLIGAIFFFLWQRRRHLKQKIILSYSLDDWKIKKNQDGFLSASLIGRSEIFSLFIVLIFKYVESEKKETIQIWRDSVCHEDWRRLKIVMNHF